MSAPIAYLKHYGVRLPDATLPLEQWIATDDAVVYEARASYLAGAVRWPTDVRGIASVALPFEFQSRDEAKAAAQKLVTFLNTF